MKHLMSVPKFLFLICLTIEFLSSYTVNGRTSNSLRITLPNKSKLVGRHLWSLSGRGIKAFMGIPYAEPPVGNLRFRAPVPAIPWKGELQAIQDSAICIQRDPFRRDVKIEGNEDCLYLNVYAPQYPKKVDELLSVMVWFHGGGFECGSGVSSFYGPDFIMDHDIIYVSVNYRLGPLGFLSTGTKDCPGNNGLKDQVVALQWVQENIATFGGNPKSVTIFGNSAGGASTTYLMMSPLSKGLFHRVISQSGNSLNPWAQPAHDGVAPKRTEILANKFGCKKHDNNWGTMIECLRSVDAATITEAFYDFFEWDTDPMVPFPPVVEPDLPGAYITKHPRNDNEPHGTSIPFMTGLTLDEGALKTAALINVEELKNNFNTNIDKSLAISLNYDHHTDNIRDDITKKIRKFYLNGGKLTKKTEQNATNIWSDGWFMAGIDEYLRKRLLEKKTIPVAPTWVYLFAHKGAASLTEIFKGGRENYFGVCHADELQYLFPLGRSLFVSAAPTKQDEKIRQVLLELWINFANTGNPTPPESNLPMWKPTKGYPLDYLRIGNVYEEDGQPLIAMENGLMDERAELWRKLQAHLPAMKLYKEEL